MYASLFWHFENASIFFFTVLILFFLSSSSQCECQTLQSKYEVNGNMLLDIFAFIVFFRDFLEWAGTVECRACYCEWKRIWSWMVGFLQMSNRLL